MIFRKNFARCALYLLVSGLAFATSFSQSPSPTPEDGAEAPVGKDSLKKMLSKVAFVRVWYLALPQSPRITVTCGGTTDPKVLGSSIRTGSLLSYRMLKPGPCTVNILSGSVIPDATGKITISQPLTPPVNLQLAPGSCSTIVVTQKDNKFEAETLADKPAASDSGSAARIMDFTGEQNLSVQVTQSGKAREIWSSKAGSPLILSSLGASGPSHFEALQLVDGKPVPVGVLEGEIAPSGAYSIVLFKDRYGHVNFGILEDAKPKVDVDELKSMVGSAAP